jgi:hypothetical protein
MDVVIVVVKVQCRLLAGAVPSGSGAVHWVLAGTQCDCLVSSYLLKVVRISEKTLAYF